MGGGFGKVLRIGAQPIKLNLDGYYNVVRPQGIGPIWELQATVTLLFR